jgi:hypothetical protein
MVFFEGVHCDIYKSSYNILKYIILEFTPYIVLPSPILEQFQQVSFFHLYTCVHSICTVFTPPWPFPTSFPVHSHQQLSPRRDLFYPPVVWFCKRRKKWYFCFFKIATQGVSLWHIHVYMYHSPIWLICIFLLSTSVPFLLSFQTI